MAFKKGLEKVEEEEFFYTRQQKPQTKYTDVTHSIILRRLQQRIEWRIAAEVVLDLEKLPKFDAALFMRFLYPLEMLWVWPSPIPRNEDGASVRLPGRRRSARIVKNSLF